MSKFHRNSIEIPKFPGNPTEILNFHRNSHRSRGEVGPFARLGANGLGSKGAQLAAELVLKMKLQRFSEVPSGKLTVCELENDHRNGELYLW